MLGVQVASALRDLYGRNVAETISGLSGTRVVLAAPDRDTAQWSADSLGRSEIEEVSEGVSYGANTIRDGVPLTLRRELRSQALPSEIMRLENFHGYFKFPSPSPIAQIRHDYVKHPKITDRYVPGVPECHREPRLSDEMATGEHNGTESDPSAPLPADAEGPIIDMFGDQWDLDLALASDPAFLDTSSVDDGKEPREPAGNGPSSTDSSSAHDEVAEGWQPLDDSKSRPEDGASRDRRALDWQ